MKGLHRREFLSLGGALLVGAGRCAKRPSAGKLAPPPPRHGLPRAWIEAPTICRCGRTLRRGSRASHRSPRPGRCRRYSCTMFRSRTFGCSAPRDRTATRCSLCPAAPTRSCRSPMRAWTSPRRMTRTASRFSCLTYRLPGEGWTNRSDVPLQDAQRAMRVIRANASRFAHRRRTRSASWAFPRAGHLAATLATQHAEQTLRSRRCGGRAQRTSALPRASSIRSSRWRCPSRTSCPGNCCWAITQRGGHRAALRRASRRSEYAAHVPRPCVR